MSVVVAGSQPIRFQWKLNGSNLVDNAHVSGSSNATLTINNLLFRHRKLFRGDEQCPRLGGQFHGGIIGDQSAADTPANPNQTVRAELTLPFPFRIGSPVLSYQWQYGGTNIAGATKSSLALANVQPSMSGNYVLTISNLYGLVQGTISLDVTDTAPYFLQLYRPGKNVALAERRPFQ